MDTKKIIKNIAILLICLSLPVLIGLNIYQHQQIKKISNGVTSEKSVNNGSTANATSVKENPEGEKAVQVTTLAGKVKPAGNSASDDLSYQIDAAEEELDMAKKQLSDEEAKKAELKKAEKELMKKSMQDPSQKKYMRNYLGIQYGDLFKELNLSPEKLEKFKDMLVDEMMAQQNIYLEREGDTTTPSKEEQKELSQRYEALNKEYETKKSELLGKDDYEKYQTYAERTGERYYVNSFMESLGSSEKLTDTQKNDLIDAMHDEAKNVRYESSNDDNSESSSNRYDEKSIARMLEFEDRQGEAYLKAAKDILPASQIEQFKTYLKQQRDMMESSIKMQALRYSAQTTEKSSDNKSK